MDRLLKKAANEAAGERKPEAYPLGYVEDFVELRTKFGAFFSSLMRGNMSAIREIRGRQIFDLRGNLTSEEE